MWKRIRVEFDALAAVDASADPWASRQRLWPPVPRSRRLALVYAVCIGTAAAVCLVGSADGVFVAAFFLIVGGLAAYGGAEKPTTDGIFTQRHTNLGRVLGCCLLWPGLALLLDGGLVLAVEAAVGALG